MTDSMYETEADKSLNIEGSVPIEYQDPLTLKLDDSVFVNTMNTLITRSRNYFTKEKNLYKRRKKNLEYYLGQQIEKLEKEKKLKDHNARFCDNVIGEAENILKPVALSRVPDLTVTASDPQNEQAVKGAEKLTEIINSRIRKRENRKTLSLAYKHRPIYFVAVIKAIWDDKAGKNGDYIFKAINPNNVDIDESVENTEADEMSWICESYEMSIKDMIMKFPDKKKDILLAAGVDPVVGPDEKQMATRDTVQEIWFTWYEQKEGEWQIIEGTAWKYKNVILKKMKNPYWDWEGDNVLFSYDSINKKKEQVDERELRQAMIMGGSLDRFSSEQIYYNYFKVPKKPYIFITHDDLGIDPYDNTSRIEQSILLQDNVNKRGQKITEMVNTAHGKNVFSSKSGLKKADIQKIDMTDPDQDILVKGNLRDVYAHIDGQQPTPALINDQEQNRQRIFQKMGSNAALRGVREGPDPATKTQLFKESDYTRIDDEVEGTINYAAEQMAMWAMQFIRVFYTDEHYEDVIGKDAKVVQMIVDRDSVEDGMNVVVSASAVDKLRRRSEAMELATMNLIDPYTFFKDLGMDDPEGRAEKLMMFQTEPLMYFQKYIMKNDTQDLVSQLQAGNEQALAQNASPTTPPPSPIGQAGGGVI